MEKRVRQWNIPALLEACVFFALAIWILIYLVSKEYLVYVTPRTLPYLIGTVIVLAVLGGVILTRLFQPNRRGRIAHVFVLSLPLIVLMLPHGTVSVSSSELASVSSSAAQSAQAVQSYPDSSPANTPSKPAVDAQQEEIDGLTPASRTIAITTENYYDWMERLYNNCTAYEGYTVTMTGYVINGSDVFAENEFALARLVMTCCTADLSPVGIICKYESASQLEPDDWYSVEGTLIAASYEIDGTTYSEPQLAVTSITPVEAVSGYVYPY